MNVRLVYITCLALLPIVLACGRSEPKKSIHPIQNDTTKSTGIIDRQKSKQYPIGSSVQVTGIVQEEIVAPNGTAIQVNTPWLHDNYFIQKIRSFKQLNIEQITLSKYPAIINNPYLSSHISTYRGVTICLDNDMFNNTDRYYTNGIHIVLHSPAFAFWQINKIMPTGKRNFTEYNSVGIHHAMYTPYTTKQPPALKDDRPYAATLLWKYTRMAVHHQKRSIRTASIDIGLIGEGALGSSLQQGVHAALPTNHEPLGWDTQISNDLILNYHYSQINTLAYSNRLKVYSDLSGSLGTHQTNANVNFGILVNSKNNGAILPGVPLLINSKKAWSYMLNMKAGAFLIAYNNTLNGGLLNRQNIYMLSSNETERVVIASSIALDLKYYRIGINLSQYYISKEFKKGHDHFYAQIAINVDI